MHAHADAHQLAFCPAMASQGMLRSYRCGDGISGMSEGHEESIALRVDLVPVILVERCT
jgi:hypothetical protein